MRVLIWCPHISPGGGIRLLQQLAPAIARHPDIETARLLIPDATIWRKRLSGLEVIDFAEERSKSHFRLWLERDGRLFDIRGTGHLKREARRFLKPIEWQREQLKEAARECDVVYCFWPQWTTYPTGINKPIVCTYHDTTIIDYPEIVGATRTAEEFERSKVWVREATQVVASSQASKSNLIRIFGSVCETAAVIQHAILPDDYNEGVKRVASVSDKLPSKYVIFPSGVNDHKGHYNLLVAWSRFSRRKQFPLVMFGGGTDVLSEHPFKVNLGSHLLRLSSLVRRLALVPGVDMFGLGHIDDRDVMPLISGATALVMPTFAEGGGSYPVEEALSVGVPVLCSDIPVMREHLHGRTAKIAWCDPYSVDSILQALNDLIDKYEAYKQSAVQGMSDPRPTWDDVAAQYIDVFKAALR